MRDKGDLEKPQKNIRKHHWKIRSILKLHRIPLKIKIDSHVQGEGPPGLFWWRQNV